MLFFYQPRPYTEEEKRRAVAGLRENATPDRDYYLLVVGAVVLAASGILLDSIPVLIASMIVAPLAQPILALGLSIPARDGTLFRRSLSTLVVSMFLAVVIGSIFSLLVTNHLDVVERTLISFFPNAFFDLTIAVVSGVIAAYGLMRPKVGAAMTGIGIGVSLLPPLVATGIGLLDPTNDLASRAATIFLLNVTGILVGSICAFVAFGLHRIKRNK